MLKLNILEKINRRKYLLDILLSIFPSQIRLLRKRNGGIKRKYENLSHTFFGLTVVYNVKYFSIKPVYCLNDIIS